MLSSGPELVSILLKFFSSLQRNSGERSWRSSVAGVLRHITACQGSSRDLDNLSIVLTSPHSWFLISHSSHSALSISSRHFDYCICSQPAVRFVWTYWTNYGDTPFTLWLLRGNHKYNITSSILFLKQVPYTHFTYMFALFRWLLTHVTKKSCVHVETIPIRN